MGYSKTEEYAYGIAEKIAARLGFEIYDVQYVKEGPHRFLRIFIEGADGVNLDQCEAVSRAVSAELDLNDFIKDNYFLEVSSPGIERTLRTDSHFDRAIGEKINVMLKDGKTFEGILTASDSKQITLDDVQIQRQNIKKANIMFDFDI